MTIEDAYVIAARRTPIGKMGGLLRSLSVEAMLAPVLRAVLADSGAVPEQVDDVVVGNVWGPGGNVARHASLLAGLDVRAPGLTIDRQCASGLEAINIAALMVDSGAASLCLAGGVESPSTAPWRLAKPSTLYHLPEVQRRARFAPDALGDPDLGPAADLLAAEGGISRARQDQFAFESHRKALEAQRDGSFSEELVALPLAAGDSSGRGETDDDRGLRDESPRARLTLRALAGLRPWFSDDGTVTAGNASPINDGAAMTAVASLALCRSLNVKKALKIVDFRAVGVDPARPGLGPAIAVRELLDAHPSIGMDDIAFFEITEAFSAQALACLDALGLEESRVNVRGGAIALGHPWGASGAVLVTRLFSELVRRRCAHRDGELGIATLAAAGGIGVATLVQAVEIQG